MLHTGGFALVHDERQFSFRQNVLIVFFLVVFLLNFSFSAFRCYCAVETGIQFQATWEWRHEIFSRLCK